MTTTSIDWSQASSNAAQAYDKAVQDAAGNIVLSIDDLMADPNVPRQLKLNILLQLGTVLGNRDQLVELGSGQPVATPPAVGGGSSTSSSPDVTQLQQDLSDKVQELQRANAQNTSLLKDRDVLKEIVLDLGLSTPVDTNTAFASDTPNKVKRAIKDKEDAARTAATPADMVNKAEVKATYDKVWGGWSTARAARTDSDKTVVALPQNRDQINEGLRELHGLVG